MSKATKVGGVAVLAAAGAALFATLAPNECPRTSACLNWQRPTQYTDGTPIEAGAAITYTVYRGLTAETVGAQSVATTSALSIVIPNTSGQTQTQFFGVTATVPGRGTSVLSNIASKLVRAPGPTDGRIEGPSDGAIED